jgi:ubiquinone/menaquinone biosynthesis C-methylase UbiE
VSRGLEIGGGPHPQRTDFEQFDAIDWSGRTGCSYVLGDARKLPYPNHSFDVVFASNLLEHFPWHETTAVLREWGRVLADDGRLEIVVPDVLGQVANYHAGVRDWDSTVELLAGSQDYEGNAHFAFFTRSTFATVLERAGLQAVSVESSHAGDGLTAVAVRREPK